MNTITLNIEDIIPYEHNARFNENTISDLKKSILEYGYNTPITVDENNIVVTGHTRLKALKELGWTEVDVVVLNMPPEKIKEYRIMDNKVQDLSSWNEAKLASELKLMEDTSTLDSFGEGIQNSVNKTAYGKTIKAVTTEDIQRAEKKLENHFSSISNAKSERLVYMKCGHCHEEFAIDGRELS